LGTTDVGQQTSTDCKSSERVSILSIQLGQRKDIAIQTQCSAFIRYVSKNEISQDLLFWKPYSCIL